MGQTYIPSSVPATFAPSPTPAVVSSGLNDLFELSSGIGMAPGGYVAPKSVRKEREQPQYVAPPLRLQGLRLLTCPVCWSLVLVEHLGFNFVP